MKDRAVCNICEGTFERKKGKILLEFTIYNESAIINHYGE